MGKRSNLRKELDETKKNEKATLAKSEELKFDPGAFDRFFDKMSTALSSKQIGTDGLPMVPETRKRVASVIIYPEQCALDSFDEPFKLTLRELDSDIELKILSRVEGSNEKALAVELGKAAIYSLNGKFLQPDQKELLWKSLNMGGRLVVGTVFVEHCSGMEGDSMEKSRASVVLE
jgi:hypothetical protein